MPEDALSDGNRTAMAYTTVGLSLTTVVLLFSTQSAVETSLQYGLLLVGVVFAVAGFLKAWNDE